MDKLKVSNVQLCDTHSKKLCFKWLKACWKDVRNFCVSPV